MQSQSHEGSPTDALLSYPVASTSRETLSPPPSQPRQLLKDRLYVGNLHPTVDEYTLVQIFSKYGNISKLDFLFHKTGPLKGKPRGYAFIEYSNQTDAARALAMANDKLLRGRKLVVTYAHQAPLDLASITIGRHRRAVSEVGKPTTLSLLKGVASGRSEATRDKIAKMEAKLRQLESTPSPAIHPSLPPKPVAFGLNTSSDSANLTRTRSSQSRNNVSLPSLPLAPHHQSLPGGLDSASPIPSTSHPLHPPPPLSRKGASSLLGVKIKKHKES